MAKLSVEQALLKAKSLTKKGELAEASKLYTAILAAFPNNKKAQQGQAALAKANLSGATQNSPQEAINQLANLFNQGQLAVVAQQAEALTKRYPNSFVIWSFLGGAHQGLGQAAEAAKAFSRVTELNPQYPEGHNNLGIILQQLEKSEESVKSFQKALSLKPDYSEAYYNMGITLKEQGKLNLAIGAYQKSLALDPTNWEAYGNMGLAFKDNGEWTEAIAAYEKALAINSNDAELLFNMGNALKDQGKLEEAMDAYNRALSVKPDYAEAYNNMGIVLADQGKLEEAIETYNKALSIKPDYADAMENSLTLAVQLLPIIANYGYDFDNNDTQVKSKLVHRPKYQVHHLIKTFLEANFSKAYSHNNNFKASDQKLLNELKLKDKIFCNAYSNLIAKLLNANWNEETASKNKVYHLGESHCLSYAHRNITISGSNFRIAPRMTFGAKAFHFSRTRHDSFKAITKAHFVSLPKSSKVLLSYGEIDCRPNEGFITAAKKLDKPLEDLIAETVLGYVQWFLEQNEGQSHRLYFMNVPAPTYYKELSADLNSEVARTVGLFNAVLKKYLLQHSFDLVDVFEFTVGNDGFSNGLFHVDRTHLGAQAIPEMEKQLT